MHKLSILLRPSRYFSAFLLLTHGGAILIFLLIDWYWWAKWLASFSVLVSFWTLFRNYISRQSRWSVIKMRLENNGIWYLTLRSGEEFKAYLEGDSFSAEKLLILNFRLESPGVIPQPEAKLKNRFLLFSQCQWLKIKRWLSAKKMISVIIFSDALDQKTFRALRIWLNLRR